MRKENEEEDEDTSSSEEDDISPPPAPVEKRVRIIDPKEEAAAGNESASFSLATAKAGTSTYEERTSPHLPPPQAPVGPYVLGRQRDIDIPGPSLIDRLADESSSSSSEEEESMSDGGPIPVYVEKRVQIIDPKEEEEAERIREEDKKITFIFDVKDQEDESYDEKMDEHSQEKNVSFYSYEKEESKSDMALGKPNVYSRYMDQNASVIRDSRRSFYIDRSQSDVVSAVSSTEFGENKSERTVLDFTHGYQKNKQYIIPPMSEHEIHRLSSNRYLDGAHNVSDVSVKDHIYLNLAYLTVNNKHDLKEIFAYVAQNMQSYGKVYAARMLGCYQEYSRLFQFSSGNEGGIVASMRFTSHCSDIIKSYVQLAALIEDSDEFSKVIIELAKRHVKLGLTLRDHQAHYRRFVEIFGATSEDRLRIYAKIYLLVCLISRSMLLAEQKLRKTDPEEDALNLIASRLEKASKSKGEMSKKQPIWD